MIIFKPERPTIFSTFFQNKSVKAASDKAYDAYCKEYYRLLNTEKGVLDCYFEASRHAMLIQIAELNFGLADAESRLEQYEGEK